MTDMDLVKVPILDACAFRWEQGRKEYRKADEPFQGDPMLELHAELLDAINYLNEAERQGVKVEGIRHVTLQALVQTRWHLRPGPPQGRDCRGD